MTPLPSDSQAPDTPVASIVFPRGVNWFYERFAERIHRELNSQGILAELCPAIDLCSGYRTTAPVALLLSPKECLASLPVAAHADRLIGAMGQFERRILVNYDCIHTDWFSAQFAIRTGLITEVVDVNMVPQTHATSLCGVPYRWIPECFTAAERTSLLPRSGARPLPWAVVAHGTPARAALVDALTRQLSPAGFAFLPPHRPYRRGTGTLTEAGLNRVLSRCDLYVWISHHEYPFHECLRALQALSNGAVPAKVDPLFSDHFADLPWVFRDVRSLRDQVEAQGLDRLYQRCTEFVLRLGSFGEHLARLFVDGSQGNAAVAPAGISPQVSVREAG